MMTGLRNVGIAMNFFSKWFPEWGNPVTTSVLQFGPAMFGFWKIPA